MGGHLLKSLFFESNADRTGVTLEALGVGKCGYVLIAVTERFFVIAKYRDLLEEVACIKRREESCGTGRRQRVVRACEVVAQRLRRVVSDEDRTGIIDAADATLNADNNTEITIPSSMTPAILCLSASMLPAP